MTTAGYILAAVLIGFFAAALTLLVVAVLAAALGAADVTHEIESEGRE